MKQQFQALGMSVTFFAIGAVFLFLARGYEYVFKLLGTFDGNLYLASGMVIVSVAILIAVQQVVLHLVIRRMEVDK